VQIEESFKAYGRHVRHSSVVIFGGVGQKPQTSALDRGVDIVVATPGRLLDLMQQGFVDLRHVEIFVLDEADRMLDMGFVRDVEKILKALPKKRQSLFFSATMPPAIVKLAHEIVHDPVKVVVTPIASTVDLIQQSMYHVDKPHKAALLMDLLADRDIQSALVFTRTKHGADTVVKVLTRNNIGAEAIHGNKAQNFRQRALANFKARKTRVLVATDIAARGIDIDDLEYVINYEIPNVPETYVHRIGRTGRAGAAGSAISFCSADEKAFVRDIEKLIGKRIPVAHDHVSTIARRVTHEDPRPPMPSRHPKKAAPAKAGSPFGGSRNGSARDARDARASQNDRSSHHNDRSSRPAPPKKAPAASAGTAHPHQLTLKPRADTAATSKGAAHHAKPETRHPRVHADTPPPARPKPGAAGGKKSWRRKR